MDASAAPTLSFTVRGPIGREDLPGLRARVCAVLERGRGSDVICDVAGVAADAVTIDALARLQLAAHRHGCRIRLRHASAELVALVAFLGLRDVLTR